MAKHAKHIHHAWWRCEKCSHEWQIYVMSRTVNRGGRCPRCSAAEKKTFAEVYPEIAKEWHKTKNGERKPENITHASNRKYWWQCRVNPDHVWEASALNRGSNQSGCPHCYNERRSQELTDYLVDAAKSNTDYYRNFSDGLTNIRDLADASLPKRGLKQIFLRLLYANVITVMETYLSDAITTTVLNDPVLMRKLVETDRSFSGQEIKKSNVYEWLDKVEKEVTDLLRGISYHNIETVGRMYSSVLDIDFPYKPDLIYRAIRKRHDIIHRNGKTHEGDEIKLTLKDIKRLIKAVYDFIYHLEEQLKRRRPS